MRDVFGHRHENRAGVGYVHKDGTPYLKMTRRGAGLDITVGDVADRLGVSFPTLYRYLPAARAANSGSHFGQ
jgi:hypothetical protein